jgi:hypothetical protein
MKLVSCDMLVVLSSLLILVRALILCIMAFTVTLFDVVIVCPLLSI